MTANNLSRQYGAANPTLTYATTGFVNGDTNAVVGGTADHHRHDKLAGWNISDHLRNRKSDGEQL